ncbi:MAG: hypothetical protein AB1Z98_19270, partial [Nannocystaceae bacterium]
KAEAEAVAEAKAPAEADSKAEATPESKPVVEPAAKDGSTLAAAVQAMVEEQASYPVQLDPLLDLVPTDAEQFMIVRDLDDLLAVGEAIMVGPALKQIATVVEAGGDAGAKADVDRVLEGFEALTLAMRGPDFDMSKGMVIADLGDDAVVIYGATKPDALPTLLRSLGASGDDMPVHCTALDGAEGYAMCSDTEAVLTAYAPGKSAAALRTKLGARLSATTLEDANLLFRVGKTEAERAVIALTTTPALLHLTLGLPDVPEGAAAMMGTGPSPALGMASPGSAFSWVQLQPSEISKQAETAPFMFKTVLDTLTGEIFMGNIAEPNALVMLAGVSDPGPAGGLVALAGTQLDKIPKTLPDGSSIEAKMRSVTIAGTATQALHIELTPAKGAELFTKMGLSPEAWLFSVGGYAGVAAGGGPELLEKIGTYAGPSLTPDVAKALPKPLAQGMLDRSVSVAMHISLDGLQSPQVAESFASVADQLPADDLPPGLAAKDVMFLATSMLAPISSISTWMPPPTDSAMEVHVALSLLGDPRTEEGKAAIDGMSLVAAGGDPAAIYGGLATRFGSSSRTMAYQARAGSRLDGALVSTAVLGMLAAIAVPAFVKYQERSKAAAKMVAPPIAEE